MILAIDVGNTNIEIGCIRGGEIVFVERIHTDGTKSELEYAISMKTVLELYGVDRKELEGGIISSVVPPLTNVLRRAASKAFQRDTGERRRQDSADGRVAASYAIRLRSARG